MPSRISFRNQFRKLISKLHLVLGLVSGLVVFIVAITGCCWVFQEEIKGLSDDYRKVQKANQDFIFPTVAKEIAEGIFPGKAIHGVLYGKPDEAIEVIFYEAEPNEFYQSVFLNPYSGEVLHKENHLSGFFAFILDGHLNLWLPEKIGNQIVRWSCVAFVVMLVTGIILWWPRNKQSRKQRLRFLWKSTTRWRRKNYDLHSLAGFYISLLALILVLTGLIMAFQSFEHVTYKALGGEKSVEFTIPKNTSSTRANYMDDTLPIDQLLRRLKQQFAQAEQYEIHYPHTDSASIYVEITYESGVFYSSDYCFYDQYSLEEIKTTSLYGRYKNADFPDKVIRMNYDIHVGSIFGLPGKILVFLISLVVATLPVTGFMLWWGRKKKSIPTTLHKRNAG